VTAWSVDPVPAHATDAWMSLPREQKTGSQ
jgi:hypothetical protein